MLALSPTTVSVGPFRVELSARFGRGATVIAVPPLGRLVADTHEAPLRVTATLQDVRLRVLSARVREDGIDGLVEQVQSDALAHVAPYAWRLVGLGAAGAAVLAAVAFRRRRPVAVAVLASVLAVGGSELAAWSTYRPAAFLSPEFSGPLSVAPQFIGKVRAATDRIEDFRAELENIVDGAVRAYTSISAGSLGAGPEIRVLHVSDIHLSPLGLDFAKELARGFDVDLVVDTGDLTSFGTRAEEVVLSAIPGLGRPYVFVRGNHDSRHLQSAMGTVRNARVVDGTVARVAGLTIYGLGHPAFTPDRRSALDDREIGERARRAGQRMLSEIRAAKVVPDVVLVHDDRMAEALAGHVPLVVSGHFHDPSAQVVDGTMFLRAGTTGGAGANVFTQEGGIPLSAQILHFTIATPQPTLVAYDRVEQSPETGDLTVRRHLVSLEFGRPSPSPPAEPTPAPTATPTVGEGAPAQPSLPPPTPRRPRD